MPPPDGSSAGLPVAVLNGGQRVQAQQLQSDHGPPRLRRCPGHRHASELLQPEPCVRQGPLGHRLREGEDGHAGGLQEALHEDHGLPLLLLVVGRWVPRPPAAHQDELCEGRRLRAQGVLRVREALARTVRGELAEEGRRRDAGRVQGVLRQHGAGRQGFQLLVGRRVPVPRHRFAGGAEQVRGDRADHVLGEVMGSRRLRV
mmetsp:Transcript_6280/g.14305  ORF Transcript_6280/g.14305 Transcript_6280/m.14305 type:complete len:202 (+) Transcript_6280:397-1002(+)